MAHVEIFVVSDKLEEMEKGKDRSTLGEAASDFQEYTESTPDEKDDSYQGQLALDIWQKGELVESMSQRELEEIEGGRVDKVSAVYNICEDYGKAKEEFTGL